MDDARNEKRQLQNAIDQSNLRRASELSIAEKLKLGADLYEDGILSSHPSLKIEDIDACVAYAAEMSRTLEARDDTESWPEWYSMSPLERWNESAKLWQFYLEAGGSLDPEPDSQSPFDAVMPHGTAPAYGRPGLRVLRRSGV